MKRSWLRYLRPVLVMIVVAAVPVAASAQGKSQELSAALMAKPDWQSEMMEQVKKSPEEQAAAYDKDPLYSAILRKHGLTASEYLAGLYALRSASFTVDGKSVPIFEGLATDANVAFLKANPGVRKKFADAEMAGIPGAK